MRVREFVQNFKDNKIANTKIQEHAVEDYVKQTLSIKEYIPFIDKREICSYVIENTCKTRNEVVQMDSVGRYMLFTIQILMKYTNLEFNTEDDIDSFDEYDMLCSSGLLDVILTEIGDEYAKCNNLLNMMLQDIVDNQRTEVIIAKFLQSIQMKIDDMADTIAGKVENLNLDLSKFDIDKIMPLIEKLKGK